MAADPVNERSTWLERKLAVPVLISALLSVPAVFMMVWGGETTARIGATVNWFSGLVLWAEWILLIWLAENKWEWVRSHKWKLGVAAATIPAVVLALGPVQVLRLVQTFAALRVLRVTRIVEAGGVVRRRMGLTGPRRTVLLAAMFLLAGVFVAVVLADPTAESRRLAETAWHQWGAWPIAAGVVVAATIGAVGLWYHRRR